MKAATRAPRAILSNMHQVAAPTTAAVSVLRPGSLASVVLVGGMKEGVRSCTRVTWKPTPDLPERKKSMPPESVSALKRVARSWLLKPEAEFATSFSTRDTLKKGVTSKG